MPRVSKSSWHSCIGAGALVHWNGASWDSIETGTRRDFYSIFLGAQKQWIAGDLGTLLSKSR